MKKTIENFPKQLRFEPTVENKEALIPAKNFIVCGMGGSHLAADLLKVWNPSLNLIIHYDYGLPAIAGDLNNYLIIISSYSGNTEEAIDSFNQAIAKKLPVACISIGGKLLELAIEHKKPYIKMPDNNIVPRSALGFSLVSLLKLMREEDVLSKIRKMADIIDMNKAEKQGKILAEKLKNFIPIIYSSEKNRPIAYNWKIKFNETGKIPSFYNAIPELNHNEMVGFDEKTRKLSENFYFIFLEDHADHPRILIRMEITKEILKNKGFPIETLKLEGKNIWEKIFFSLLTADWTAYYTAEQYGIDAQKTEIIDRLKSALKNHS